MEVAKTILEQLGGNKFLVMTGAKDLVALESGLRFKLGRKFFTVRLNQFDTYDLTLSTFSMKTLEHKIIDENTGVYVSDLRNMFTAMTGLYCTLGTMGGAA
jgi:hypothetical protein